MTPASKKYQKLRPFRRYLLTCAALSVAVAMAAGGLGLYQLEHNLAQAWQGGILLAALAFALLATVAAVFAITSRKLLLPLNSLTESVLRYDMEGIHQAARSTSAVELHSLIAGMVALISEIQDRSSALERMVEIRTRELSRSLEELERTQATLINQEKLASIGRISAGVAHEINNPAGYVSGNLEVLQEYVEKLEQRFQFLENGLAGDDGAQRSAAERAAALAQYDSEHGTAFVREDIPKLLAATEDGMERIKNIVRGLGVFVGPQREETELCELGECINDTVEIVWNQLKYDYNVSVDLQDEVYVRAVKNNVEQVLINLTLNARDALSQNGTVSIRLFRHGAHGVIEVEDDGDGIPAAALENIFEPFFTTKPVGYGTGLGLYVSRRLIEDTGGQIEVFSTVGSGTTFRVQLPVAEPGDLDA